MYDYKIFPGFPEEPMPEFDFVCNACGTEFIATGINCFCPRCRSKDLATP